MRLGRWEVQRTPDMKHWRISGGRELPVTDADLSDLGELLKSVLRRPSPDPEVPADYLAMIERRLAELEKRAALESKP